MSKGKTRIVHLAKGQRREEALNRGTCVVVFDRPLAPASFRAAFTAHYEAIRRECTEFAQAGLAIIAIDIIQNSLAGSVCMAAKIDMPNAAIVGRHGMADLYLDGDLGLSLRHLAIITSPLVSSHDEVRFRIVDLRTETAFADEHGKPFEALMAEGPLFVRCGQYALFVIPTGDPTMWPDSAEDGWECIPERVYLNGAAAEPDRWQRLARGRVKARAAVEEDGPRQKKRDAVTMVHSMAGPVRARTRLVAPGEEPIGTLRISSKAGVQTIALGAQAAGQGVLLGRYERCDIDGVNVLTEQGISRVHLLIIDIDGRLYAIDTASTHGTWLGDEDEREVRVLAVAAGTRIKLAGKLASLQFSPA